MENKYLLLTFDNGKELLKMGVGQDIGVTSINGVEAPTYSIHTSSIATSDGSLITGEHVDERIIDLSWGIKNRAMEETIRRKMQSFFNPKSTIILKINHCYNQARIECKLRSFKVDSKETMWSIKTGSISLLCPFPYWSDLDNYGRNIAAFTPQFTFPLAITTFFKNKGNRPGKIMGYKTLSTEVNLHNKGDVATGLEVRFVAKRGAVTKPKISKLDTEEFIELLVEMKKGDVVVVNTNVGEKSIHHNGKNIFKDKNKLSSFFQLDIGDNIIKYDAQDNTYTNLDVDIYYTPKYLGV